MFTIYKYTNSITGKVYIGQTSKTLSERAQYKGSNYRQCIAFYEAITEYGWDSFIPEIIDTANTQSEAYEKEAYYIQKYNSDDSRFGYNILPGGQPGAIADSVREKISSKAKDRYKDKTVNPMYGKTHTKETLSKMSECKMGSKNPMYGTTWNETQRIKCGTKGKKLNLSKEQREILGERVRKVGKEVGLNSVRCIEDDKVFNSITEAASEYGITVSTLSGHLHGRQHTCKGKHFEFVKINYVRCNDHPIWSTSETGTGGSGENE